MQPSDLTTTSLGRLSWRPWKLLATTVMLPSSSCRVTRRESCSQATSRPCRSRVKPLARLVGSSSNDTPLPGSYFMRRLLWMSLNTRWPPSRHHNGPSAGPCAPPNPSARSWIGSDAEMILSSSGADDSIRFDDCDMAFLLIWPRGASNEIYGCRRQAGRRRLLLPLCGSIPFREDKAMPTRNLD